MHFRSIPTLCVLLAALPISRAQEPSDSTDATAPQRHYVEVHAALDAWKSAHGDSWELVYEKQTGAGRFLYGGSATTVPAPRTDAEYLTAARRALADTFAIHRIDDATLVDDEVMFLPLANAGTTDKMTVQFRQVVGGVPVIHGFANVLFDMHGHILSVDSTAMPELARFNVSPSIDAERATEAAIDAFQRDTGRTPTSVGAADLAIDQVVQGKFRLPVLVWSVVVLSEPESGDARGFEYRVDARTGAMSSSENAIHTFDVSGNVTSMTSPGNRPDVGSNPPQALAMPNMTVSSSSGSATTDVSGNFNIVGASAPLVVTVRYTGPYATVVNQASASYVATPSLAAASGNSVLMNSPASALNTAQSNAFLAINLQRNWTRSVNPADATHDFLATANVNIANSCNAYYSGNSTNFYQAGGSCVNTAYQDIVMHEMGHWMNDRYGSGNNQSGFGEGNADVFAIYFTDDPVLGHDFQGPGSIVRTGLNTRPFCGDSSSGCYGEVHADGEVLMGALWKVRARLKTTLGVSAGGAVANTLFNAWMNAYNDSLIQTIIETHWLTLDDNDANISNGTPHHADIDGGFRQQGFPGHTLTYFTFSNVTQLSDTQDETGPYVVSANITALLNPPLSSVTLNYKLGNGSFASVPMSLVSGSTWSAAIPGQSCVTDVGYYVSATDSSAHSETYPAGAPTSYFAFTVGSITSAFSDTFEAGTGGWTHALLAAQDDWQLSSQFGLNISGNQGGDPTVPATSGSSVWGNDLGPAGWNGVYRPSVSNYLRSPVINCSQFTSVKLRFKRWLRIEAGQYDQAQIKVNGAVVWSNPLTTDLLDTSWVPMNIDVTQFAAGQANVQVEFTLVSDAGLEYGGWNIDDFALVAATPCTPQCSTPQPYCSAKVTSQLSVPAIGATGSSTLAANDFHVTLSASLPNKQAIVFWGTAPASSPFLGGFLCVHQPVHRLPATQTNGVSFASIAIPIDASMPGTQRRYQWWFRDPGDAYTIGLSDGLLVTFCQ